jgi:3-methyladenine DNA glycosylase AlkD
MPLKDIRRTLRKFQDKGRAKTLLRFFKTGPGEYAEGDIFLGITVPQLRKLAKEFQNLKLELAAKLLKSPIHEERLLALLILILQYRKSDIKQKEKIYRTYIKNIRYINNWDLVDVTAKHIIGDFLREKDKTLLYELARSDSIWERRVAVLSTFHFIENCQFGDTIRISGILLSDKHDLIHKAVGWALREVGKRDPEEEEKFLKKHYKIMPRTMLRYAIERFPESKRKLYLKKGEVEDGRAQKVRKDTGKDKDIL